jgi:hypothetical protein
MNYKEKHKKLNDFILSWVNAVYDTDEKKSKFYTYLGIMIQSRLMSNVVNLDDDYVPYQIVGVAPLVDMINDYDIDVVYNEWMKEQEVSALSESLV